MGASLRVLIGYMGREESNSEKSLRCVGYKRQRSPVLSGGEEKNVIIFDDAESGDVETATLLRLRLHCFDGVVSARLYRSITCGARVQNTYGCHYHLYSTASPEDSHGEALCWSLQKSPLNIHSFMCLGRLANSCRKDLLLLVDDIGLLLSYTATL